MAIAPEAKMMRRVVGYHDIRLDGLTDLLLRARGARVMDIGCNRGLVGFEFANNGAEAVHGCDNYENGIEVARHLFMDLRNCESRFEVIDLTQPCAFSTTFTNCRYDIVVMLATYHKLKRIMTPQALSALMRDIGERTIGYFAWRATSEKTNENEAEMAQIDRDMQACKLRRIHTSYISLTLGVAAIWGR
jgi:SAM-dependent methyltransferase